MSASGRHLNKKTLIYQRLSNLIHPLTGDFLQRFDRRSPVYNTGAGFLSYSVHRKHEAKKKKYLEILYSNPAGFELTARLTTNYRCLKNIYIQRHDHRLPEWKEFCEWMKTLPMFKKLCLDGLYDNGVDVNA